MFVDKIALSENNLKTYCHYFNVCRKRKPAVHICLKL